MPSNQELVRYIRLLIMYYMNGDHCIVGSIVRRTSELCYLVKNVQHTSMLPWSIHRVYVLIPAYVAPSKRLRRTCAPTPTTPRGSLAQGGSAVATRHTGELVL